MKSTLKFLLISIFTLLFTITPAIAVLNDAVVYYSFDDDDLTGSNPNNLAGASYDGIATGVTTGGPGKLGQSFYFDGTDDYINTTFVTSGSGNWTVIYWINVTASSQPQSHTAIWSAGGLSANNMAINPSNIGGNYEWAYHNPPNTTQAGNIISISQNIGNTTWVSIANVYDGNVNKMYINGEHYADSITAPADWSASTHSIFIARENGNPSRDLLGYIDEFAIYDRRLSDDEIRSFHNQTENPYAGGPVLPFTHIKITDIFDNANLEGINVTLTDGTSNLTQSDGIAYFYNKTTQNFTATDPNNLYFDYNSTTTPTENSTTTYQVHGVKIYIESSTSTLQGRSITYPYNLSVNGTVYTINDSSSFGYGKPNASNSIYFSKEGFYNLSATALTYGGKVISNLTTTSWANTELQYTGDTSGLSYVPVCTYNSSTLNNNGNYYDFSNNSGTVSCESASNYDSFSYSLALTNVSALNPFPASQNITIEEWKLSLSFNTNTTGNILWTHPTNTSSRGQFPLESDTGYNTTTFQYIKVKSTWDDGTKVTVFFNPTANGTSNNETGQYYEYINNVGTITTENVTVLDKLDKTVWVKVYNFGQEELLEASISVYYCGTDVGQECNITSQRLTSFVGGNSYDGVPIYLDNDLAYWFVISKDGYDSESQVIRSLDTIDDSALSFNLRPTLTSYQHEFRVIGNNFHSNESTHYFIVSNPDGGNYYYNTTTRSALQTEVFTQGGDLLSLTGGLDFAYSQNYTIYFWTLNSTSGLFEFETSKTVTYQETTSRDFLSGFGDNPILNAVLWVVLILISGFVGMKVQVEEGKDTGFYAFSIGGILLGFISYASGGFFVPIGMVLIAMGFGHLAFSGSRE